jgi:hypothetical protein
MVSVMYSDFNKPKITTAAAKDKEIQETLEEADPTSRTELSKVLGFTETEEAKTKKESAVPTSANQQKLPDDQHESAADFKNQQASTLQAIQSAQNQNPFMAPDGSTPPVLNYGMNDTGNFTGQFACSQNNGGSVTGLDRADCKPKNKGGQIENELFYAIVNAAEVSGAKVSLVSCHRPGATIAGSGNISKHASGEAIDLKPTGSEQQKMKFILAVLANTDKYNSIGSYAGESHTHVGADRNQFWTHFLKGVSFPPLYKTQAFLRAKVAHFDKNKTKAEVSKNAKEALKQICNSQTPSV